MKTTTILCAVTLSAVLSPMAHAQTVMTTTNQPFRAAIGVYSPSSSGMRRAAGSSMPMLSLSYDVSKTLDEKPLIYGVYFDYAQNKQNGTTNSLTAFGISGRYLTSAPLGRARYYAGGGVGSYSVKVGSTNSKIGGKLFGGYERNDGYYGEASYHIINKVNGFDPSGLGLQIGKRF